MRVIRGYATRWGRVDLQNEWFAKGAFDGPGLTVYPSIYLVDNHDLGKVVGVLVQATPDAVGLLTHFAMFGTAAGVDAVRLIDDARAVGARLGLSVGFLAREKTAARDGSVAILRAALLHVALTPQPALPDARLDGDVGPAVAKRYTAPTVRPSDAGLAAIEAANLAAMVRRNGVEV